MGSTVPTEYAISTYLNPRYAYAVHEFYRNSDRSIVKELVQILTDRCGQANEDDDVTETTVQVLKESACGNVADEWASRFAMKSSIPDTRCATQNSIRKEYNSYRSEMSSYSHSTCDSRK